MVAFHVIILRFLSPGVCGYIFMIGSALIFSGFSISSRYLPFLGAGLVSISLAGIGLITNSMRTVEQYRPWIKEVAQNLWFNCGMFKKYKIGQRFVFEIYSTKIPVAIVRSGYFAYMFIEEMNILLRDDNLEIVQIVDEQKPTFEFVPVSEEYYQKTEID